MAVKPSLFMGFTAMSARNLLLTEAPIY